MQSKIPVAKGVQGRPQAGCLGLEGFGAQRKARPEMPQELIRGESLCPNNSLQQPNRYCDGTCKLAGGGKGIGPCIWHGGGVSFGEFSLLYIIQAAASWQDPMLMPFLQAEIMLHLSCCPGGYQGTSMLSKARCNVGIIP